MSGDTRGGSSFARTSLTSLGNTRILTRDEVFESLHKAHSLAWDKDFRGGFHPSHRFYERFHAWRMAWWIELEHAFPDKIRDGVRYGGRDPSGQLPRRL